MTFKQFLMILHARWKVALGILVVFASLALAYAFLTTKLYTASATVVVDFRPDPDSSSNFASQLSMASYIATQVDIITSPRVAQRTVKILGLDRASAYEEDWRNSTGGHGDPVVWIGNLVREKLAVAPSRDSNVINISVTLPDPKFAAVLANGFAQAYIDTVIELKVDAAKHYAAWFDERSRELRAELEAKQKRLADYERESGRVPTDGRLDIENARLAELNSELVTVQGLRQDSQSRQRQLNQDNESLREVLESPVIAGLKNDLARAETKLRDIAANSGKNYPDYKTTEAEVASLRERIALETSKIAASLANTTQINMRRENDVIAAIAAQKKHMQELTHQNDEATILQNDVVAAQRNLDVVTQRLAQSSLEGAAQQTNISVLTPAVEPLKRSSPKRTVILAIGLFLGTLIGGFTALAQELMHRRVRSDEEMAQLLGVPLLTKIARVGTRDRGDSPAPAPVLAPPEPQAI